MSTISVLQMSVLCLQNPSASKHPKGESNPSVPWSADEYISKVRCVQATKRYAALTRKELQTRATAWINVK